MPRLDVSSVPFAHLRTAIHQAFSLWSIHFTFTETALCLSWVLDKVEKGKGKIQTGLSSLNTWGGTGTNVAGPEEACLVGQRVKAWVLLGGWEFFSK